MAKVVCGWGAIAEKQISTKVHLYLYYLMITLEQCGKILNNGIRKYSNDEVKQIRDYLYIMAKLQLETENRNNN